MSACALACVQVRVCGMACACMHASKRPNSEDLERDFLAADNCTASAALLMSGASSALVSTSNFFCCALTCKTTTSKWMTQFKIPYTFTHACLHADIYRCGTTQPHCFVHQQALPGKAVDTSTRIAPLRTFSSKNSQELVSGRVATASFIFLWCMFSMH